MGLLGLLRQEENQKYENINKQREINIVLLIIEASEKNQKKLLSKTRKKSKGYPGRGSPKAACGTAVVCEVLRFFIDLISIFSIFKR